MMKRDPDLSKMIDALNTLRGGASTLDRGKQEANQQGDYRRDDYKFDQAICLPSGPVVHCCILLWNVPTPGATIETPTRRLPGCEKQMARTTDKIRGAGRVLVGSPKRNKQRCSNIKSSF
jgi:hypothetical protein